MGSSPDLEGLEEGSTARYREFFDRAPASQRVSEGSDGRAGLPACLRPASGQGHRPTPTSDQHPPLTRSPPGHARGVAASVALPGLAAERGNSHAWRFQAGRRVTEPNLHVVNTDF